MSEMFVRNGWIGLYGCKFLLSTIKKGEIDIFNKQKI